MKILKNAYFRVFLYCLLFLVFFMLGDLSESSLMVCPINRLFGLDCPGCGTTRAFANIMRLNISEALALNPVFILFILPASVVLFIQDTVCAICSTVCGRKKTSFVDFVLSIIFGD